MRAPVDRRPVQEQIAELLDRARAAHDARLALPTVRAFWLPPECQLGCACHPQLPDAARGRP